MTIRSKFLLLTQGSVGTSCYSRLFAISRANTKWNFRHENLTKGTLKTELVADSKHATPFHEMYAVHRIGEG